MADFWGGFAKGFAPAYESASARRIRAEEWEEAKKAREDAAALAAAKVKENLRRWEVEQKAKKDALDLAALQRQENFNREDAQLRIKRAQAVQDREDAERRGDIKEAEKADAAIQSFDEEIRKKVQPKAPPLLGGPAMGVPGAAQQPSVIPRYDIDEAMPSVMPGERPRSVPPPTAPARPPAAPTLGALPVPREFEGSPEIMESIRKDLEAERGEIPIGDRLAAAMKGERLQKIKLEAEKRRLDFESQAKLKRVIPGTAPARPKLPIGDVLNEIIQMHGQLGDKVPGQSLEALEVMGDGPLRKL